MARHKQPREVAELKGADKRNPQRYKGEVIKSDVPIGDPFESMSGAAKTLWKEISDGMPSGVLTYTDRHMFKVLCNLIAEYDSDPVTFQVGKYTHMIGLAARFGMTAADKQKFISEKPQEKNPFADLLN